MERLRFDEELDGEEAKERARERCVRSVTGLIGLCRAEMVLPMLPRGGL